MVPEGVGIHITRLKTDDFTTNETLLRHIEHMAEAAARIQPDTKPNVMVTAAPVDLSLLEKKFSKR